MPRQSSVDAAYSPIGGKQQVSVKCDNFCISILFTIIVTCIFLVGAGNTSKEHHEFQAGQATMIYSTTDTSSTRLKTSTTAPDNNSVLVDENIQIVLEEAEKEIKDAEAVQLALGTTAIDTMTTKVTNNLRIGVGKKFGATLSNDEVEAIATQVQTQLKNEAQSKLRSRADFIAENAISAIENNVSDEEDMNMDEFAIEKGVINDQQTAVRDIKYGMDTELNAVRKVLPSRAVEIEKAILEERLSLKLGKRVRLIVDDDNEIYTPGSDDELFNALNSITKTAPSLSLSENQGNNSSIISLSSNTIKNQNINNALSTPMKSKLYKKKKNKSLKYGGE